jgi:hypothetical protein
LGDEINTLAICDIDSDDKNEVSFYGFWKFLQVFLALKVGTNTSICIALNSQNFQLIAGTSGTEIKVLKNASLLKELNEGEPTCVLCPIQQGSFGFGLSNGVIGIYK